MAGQLRVDEITDEAGTGSPDFINGIKVEGTTFTSADLEGSPDQGQAVVFTSPGTWTKPATVKRIKVTVVGGGSGSPTVAFTGGSAGGAAIKWIPAPSIPGPVSVTIGAGAVAAGGTSSFGAFCSATGGGLSAGTGGLGGSGSGGDLNINGQGIRGGSDSGGGSILGGGAGATNQNGGNYGGGGSPSPGETTTSGSNGVVIVEEFY